MRAKVQLNREFDQPDKRFTSLSLSDSTLSRLVASIMVAGPHRNRLPNVQSRQVASTNTGNPDQCKPCPLLSPSLARTIDRLPITAMSAANFFIPSLPGQPSSSSLVQYSGHIPSAPIKNGQPDTNSDAHIFFYMIRNKHIADQERTLLWFNGGPGCSSFDGALMEVGPLRLVPGEQGKLKEVDGAWNEYANVIFSKFDT